MKALDKNCTSMRVPRSDVGRHPPARMMDMTCSTVQPQRSPPSNLVSVVLSVASARRGQVAAAAEVATTVAVVVQGLIVKVKRNTNSIIKWTRWILREELAEN